MIRGDIKRDRRAILKELDNQGLDSLNPLRHIFERNMGNNVLVIRDPKGDVVGGVQFDIRKQWKELVVTDMRVLPKKQGYGTRAFKAMAETASENGYSMKVTNAVESAKPFYAKLGAVFQKGFGTGSWTPAARDALAKGSPVQGDTSMPYEDWVKIDFD